MFDPGEFPRIAAEGFTKTSCVSNDYNCIAWAANDQHRWWWPTGRSPSGNETYWPSKAPSKVTLKAFVLAFKTLGYEPCKSGELEEGYEKIAIYADGVIPTHAARQLADGTWTHKMGRNIDITASLTAVETGIYGEVVRFLKRKRRKRS